MGEIYIVMSSEKFTICGGFGYYENKYETNIISVESSEEKAKEKVKLLQENKDYCGKYYYEKWEIK